MDNDQNLLITGMELERGRFSVVQRIHSLVFVWKVDSPFVRKVHPFGSQVHLSKTVHVHPYV